MYCLTRTVISDLIPHPDCHQMLSSILHLFAPPSPSSHSLTTVSTKSLVAAPLLIRMREVVSAKYNTWSARSTRTLRRVEMAIRIERPSSVKLAGVKHELYHPLLPTLRKMDMDDVTKRLPDEHSRTSTPCSRGLSPSVVSILYIYEWLYTELV